MDSPLDRLTTYGNELLASLREGIATKRVTRFGPVNASGRLAASLRVLVEATPTGYRLSLYGAAYALALEYGRSPGRFPPLLSIRQWIEDKGLAPRPDAKGRTPSTNSLAYLIGRAIANKGTTIYQQGQPTGLFGQLIAPDIAVQQLGRVLLPVFEQQVLTALRQAA